MRRYLALVLLIALMITACAVAQATDTTVWPQSFSLYAGKQAVYTFQVTTPGTIAVTSTWTGCGLAFLLTDPTGKIVNLPPVLKSSPASVAYTATKAQIDAGTRWTLTIGTPPAPAPSQKPVATGTVTVKVPQIAHIIVPQGPAVLTRPDLVLPPSVASVTPDNGGPGDMIKVVGRGIPEDRTKAEVWFTLSTNVTRQGYITKVTKSGSTITYDVQAPPRDYIQYTHKGPMWVKLKGSTTTTNTLDFNYVPYPPPTISGHSPQYGLPGRRMTLTGTHFGPKNGVYFVAAGQSDMASPSVTNDSASQITAVIPPDFKPDMKAITVYLTYQIAGGPWQKGPRYQFPLDPSYVPAKPK